MGCQIGKRTILTSPIQASDWNAVSFGNDCTVAGILQFHTLENMMLKVKRTDIQDGSAVNFGATVMGGAVIEPEITLLPLSMVLKEMHLSTGIYEGSPTEPVSGDQHASFLITQPRPGGGQSKLPGEAATDEESRPTRLTVPDD
jgi:hypothetical protein